MRNVKKISLDSICKPKEEEEILLGQRVREARSAAIRYIGVSNRSSGQVRVHLQQLDMDPDIVESTLLDLIEEGYINDIRIARRILRERQAGKAESKAALRNRMARQGIDGSVINDLAEEMMPDEVSAMSLLRNRLSKELQAISNANRLEKQRLFGKMSRFLQSRGYSSGCAGKVICDALAGQDDCDFLTEE